jgi:hypothetical protein
MSREIADHLRYFADMGLTGLSRDPAWRERADVAATEVPLIANATVEAPSVESLDEI